MFKLYSHSGIVREGTMLQILKALGKYCNKAEITKSSNSIQCYFNDGNVEPLEVAHTSGYDQAGVEIKHEIYYVEKVS